MADIVTLTVNPSIDTSVYVERVAPFQKLRVGGQRRDPGGGGINVARVLKRFGADVTAIYTTGGALGQLLRRLVDLEGIPALTAPLSGETREDFTVNEESTGLQYRFVLPGPHFAEEEWHSCLEVFAAHDQQAHFVVASGSLPPGVPDDFYARVARLAKERQSKVVVDTTSRPLRAALQAGVYLIKPSLNEFRGLIGGTLETQDDWIKACRSLVDSGQVEIVALTLGERGALLVTPDLLLRAPALSVKPVSVVGAGDSFLGAMVWSLSCGHAVDTAFRHGVAGGSAALLMPGTELCRREDVERLVNDVELIVL
jgi:6-phosphofructokinase 2